MIATCKVEGCDKKHNSHGYCITHVYRFLKYGDPETTRIRMNEGLAFHPLYKTYRNMLNRCYKANQPNYADYGGRGIKVCDRWHGKDGFTNFIEDMGERPKGLTLDRRNNNAGYSPDNCRWADYSTQGHNQRLSKRNKSGYKGVSKLSTCDRWQALITVKGKRMYLGVRQDLNEAIELRKAAEIKYGIEGQYYV